MPKPIIVDGYCRVSRDIQEDNTSLDEQERSIRAYCAANGLIVGLIHREVFTGSVYREREKLSLMRERYQTGKIQGVVVWVLDRLSRNQIHVAVLMDEMEHHGVTLHAVKEPVATDPIGRFVMNALALVAEMEREKIIDRTMTGRVNSVLRGEMKSVSTHRLRYGFQWADAERSRIVLSTKEVAPGETEADIVRWMAEQYADGISMHSLRQQLDARGIPSPSGNTWRECTILRILSDRRITGENAQVFVNKAPRYKMHHDTLNVPDGTYPQIITTELFERLQHRMALNKAHTSRAAKQPEEFLLRAGYIRCGVCGWSMSARVPQIGNPLYRCRRHGLIASKPVDAAVWAKVEQLADHVVLIEQAIQLATNDTRLQHDVTALDASIERWQTSANNFLGDLNDPALTGESRAVIRKQMNDALVMVQKLEGERAVVAAGLIDREREQAVYAEILDWCMTVKEARGQLDYQHKRDFLDMLGVVVTVHYDKEHHSNSYDMRVRLPALQALISLPSPAASCDANTVV